MIPDKSIFLDFNSSVNFLPFVSFPITPYDIALPFKLLILLSTLAAPPKTNLSSVMFTTGTGASGEILDTLPIKYSSNIISPTTAILTFSNWSKISFNLDSDIIILPIKIIIFYNRLYNIYFQFQSTFFYI